VIDLETLIHNRYDEFETLVTLTNADNYDTIVQGKIDQIDTNVSDNA
jgi:hypothetical protein